MNNKKLSHSTIAAMAGTNFLSTLNPAFFGTFAALLIYHSNPIFQGLAHNIFFVFALYAVPLLFTGVPEHFLTTKYSRRNVITFSRFFEAITGFFSIFILFFYPGIGRIGLLCVVVVMGIEYAMYRPALKGYAAEKLPKHLLSWSCAITESTTFFGIVAGAWLGILAIYVVNHFGSPLFAAGCFSFAIASYSLLLATRLDPDLARQPNVKFSEIPRQWLDTLRKQPRYRELVITGIGESYIFGMMIFVAAVIVQYSAIHLENFSRPHICILIPSAAVGCGLGCLLAGYLSRANVELGIVPPSVLAMMIFSLLVGALPCYADFYMETMLLGGEFFLFGIFAGLMLVPVQAYQLFFVKRSLQPAFFAWFYLPFGVGILLAITLSFLISFYNVSIYAITSMVALLTFILAVASFVTMPQFLLRMLMQILLLIFYRLRIFHKERMPEDGPALIVANRSSLVDLFFISACTTRPVRFMIHEKLFSNPFMRPLYTAAGFLKVSTQKPRQLKTLFEKTREVLAKGEMVCIFPEPDITRNGTMSGFRGSVANLIPPGMDVPIIPIRIGMTWGSIFSGYYAKFKLRFPSELPHPASITIGKPVPSTTSAYELRVILTELAAETELIPTPQERPFHAQFAFLAKRSPFRRTIREISSDGEKAPCNFTILLKALLLSRALRRICEDSTEYVGILLPNSINAILSILAVQMADKCPAILNYTSGKEANSHAIKSAKIKHIITSKAFLEKQKLEVLPEMVFIEDLMAKGSSLSRRIRWGLAATFLYSSELMRLASPGSFQDVNRPAVVIFSSGSTGIPKGIMLTHHNVTGDVMSLINTINWSKNDRILGNLPLFHSFGMNVCMWLPIMTGAETCLVPNPLDAHLIGEALSRRKLTVLMATPGFLQTYMRRCPKEVFRSLRLVVTGAEKLREDIAAKFRAMTNLTIVEGYGCTELSPIVSFNLPTDIRELGMTVAKEGSIGPALTGICAKVVDPISFQLMPENTDGLLIVKGANVMLGYLNDPQKTKEVIRDNWYITGDIAQMDRNGFITITGRLSRFSKIAGEMVPHELVEREINNILLPDDRIVAVCGAADTLKGEKLIVFYCDDELIHPSDLIRRMREKGIPNLWIPREENFIRIDSLPLLGSGKLDLASLSRLAKDFGNRITS